MMGIRLLTLCTPRTDGEGLRVGAVRHVLPGLSGTPSGAEGGYDVWFPTLAPSMEALRLQREAKTGAQRANVVRKYRAELARPECRQAIDLLASLSRRTSLVLACYCEDEFPCQMPVLAELLAEYKARFAAPPDASPVTKVPASRRGVRQEAAQASVVVSFPARSDAGNAEFMASRA
jgi:uncharacterized protein YeaO (DUF488 family)